eukprot:GHVS01037537.1.p1 GENE.GHVS01037537.1~~GHVS01037537.1.p1  ORF type:complete len:838 (-),score=241.09 GHVS01037537.1:127-2640(-)
MARRERSNCATTTTDRGGRDGDADVSANNNNNDDVVVSTAARCGRLDNRGGGAEDVVAAVRVRGVKRSEQPAVEVRKSSRQAAAAAGGTIVVAPTTTTTTTRGEHRQQQIQERASKRPKSLRYTDGSTTTNATTTATSSSSVQQTDMDAVVPLRSSSFSSSSSSSSLQETPHRQLLPSATSQQQTSLAAPRRSSRWLTTLSISCPTTTTTSTTTTFPTTAVTTTTTTTTFPTTSPPPVRPSSPPTRRRLPITSSAVPPSPVSFVSADSHHQQSSSSQQQQLSSPNLHPRLLARSEGRPRRRRRGSSTAQQPQIETESFYDVEEEEFEGPLLLPSVPPTTGGGGANSSRTTRRSNLSSGGASHSLARQTQTTIPDASVYEDVEDLLMRSPPDLDLTLPALGGASSFRRSASRRNTLMSIRRMPPSAVTGVSRAVVAAATRVARRPGRTSSVGYDGVRGAAHGETTAPPRPPRTRGPTRSSGLLDNGGVEDAGGRRAVVDHPGMFVFPPVYHATTGDGSEGANRHSFVFGWTSGNRATGGAVGGSDEDMAERLTAAIQRRPFWRHILPHDALRRWGMEEVQEGMSVEQIALLPSCTVKARTETTGDDGNEGRGFGCIGGGSGETSTTTVSCGICMDVYKVGEIQRRLECLHVFHSECVDKWLKLKGRCPVCKFDCKGSARAGGDDAVAAARSTAEPQPPVRRPDTPTPGRRTGTSTTTVHQQPLRRGTVMEQMMERLRRYRAEEGPTRSSTIMVETPEGVMVDTTEAVVVIPPPARRRRMSEEEGVEFLGFGRAAAAAQQQPSRILVPPVLDIDEDMDVIVGREEIVLPDDWSLNVQLL